MRKSLIILGVLTVLMSVGLLVALVVRTLDDAILAAIELHDLPAPDDSNTSELFGAGCAVPPASANTNVAYGASPADVICPSYDSSVSQTNRSDAREVHSAVPLFECARSKGTDRISEAALSNQDQIPSEEMYDE
jgi:hypothetical protein